MEITLHLRWIFGLQPKATGYSDDGCEGIMAKEMV